ncbi:GNAT family N-acetyltransferase [Rhizobium sp. KVB221]|uniref:GNAT family N-acetyltransferase n=1 Tax=Rhizobium setariae TaxID=2801340 RepID=A0A936YQW6_9HYPH|nr:GNAT family protein [Rhizobium setariae]MBL0370710.1 GNAT family N-acetyltransferase [Rhizobium setariae]
MQNAPSTDIRRAIVTDISAIMQIERQPGYELLVGRWEADQHFRNITDRNFRYLVADSDNGRPIAFAALSGFEKGNGLVLINRLIVKTPGMGVGKQFLRAVMAFVFENTQTQRLWLRVVPDNTRARHVYQLLGFSDEGVLEKAGTRPDGVRVDLAVMSIQRAAWEASLPPS